MFYFPKTPFYTTNLKEITQFQKVIKFRKELEKLGVLFWEFESSLQFERNVREHLIRQVLKIFKVEKTEIQPFRFLISTEYNKKLINILEKELMRFQSSTTQ